MLIQQEITRFAKNLGFDLIGFTKAKINKKYLQVFENWVSRKQNGKMNFLSDPEKIEKRKNFKKILAGAASVIVLAVNYYHEQKPLKKGFGRVARYAFGRDYHKIIKQKLKILEKFIAGIGKKHFKKPVFTKSYVDTGPILERALAVQAGLGKIGKNSCLITKEFGSWVLLAEIITNIDIAGGAEKEATAKNSQNKGSFSLCGECQRCKNACPTGAIVAPGIIDSRKCISYLTIENKSAAAFPKKTAKILAQEKRLFGCDICQEVCPHNISRQKQTSHIEFLEPKIAGDEQNLKKIACIKSDEEFLKKFAGSPLMRAKKTGLQRNAKTTIQASA